LERDTILIVDDEFLNRQLLSVTLKDAGYHTLTADNGQQALDILNTCIPDTILLDLLMPEMDGFDVLKHLKADKRFMHIPVIVVSAADEIKDVVTCIEMGAEDHLSKPFEPILLHARVKSSLNKNRLLMNERELSKNRISMAVETGRAQQTAMILHNIGNGCTPITSSIKRVETFCEADTDELFKKCWDELNTHYSKNDKTLVPDKRIGQIFSYLGELIHSTIKNHDGIRQQCKKVEKSLDYIADILTLQQNYSESGKSKKEKLVINRLIDDAVHMQTKAFEDGGIRVIKDFNLKTPKILVSKGKLMQVVMNLIKNSIEALKPELPVPQDKTITLTTDFNEEGVVLKFQDNGDGILAENFEKIFDFGFSTKGASGFGLYFSHEFLESCGAGINIKSTGPSQGTIVTIVFPSSLIVS